MSTHNLCFEQKYEKYQSFLSEIFQFLEVKFSIYFGKACFSNDISKFQLLFPSMFSPEVYRRLDVPTARHEILFNCTMYMYMLL